MSGQFQRPQLPHQYSRDGFHPIERGDATIDIPLQQIDHTGQDPQPPPGRKQKHTTFDSSEETMDNHVEVLYPEKAGSGQIPPSPFSYQGMRKIARGGRHSSYGSSEKIHYNKMGSIYKRVLAASTLTRYIVYVVPVGILLAVPIVVGATAAHDATIGDVNLSWFFGWVECCWVGLWGSKLLAHWLPYIFQFLCGIVSSGTRKYATLLRRLEIILSLVGWALVALATFKPIMTRNPVTRQQNAEYSAKNGGKAAPVPHWINVVEQILAAALISSLIFLGERVLIQLISINYHRKQFAFRILDSKRHVQMLTMLYEASRAMFPTFCVEFAEEDAVIADTLDIALGSMKKHKNGQASSHHRSGSSTPMRLLRDVGRFGDKVTSAVGNIAQEVTGKQVFNPDSAHSIVVTALEKTRSSEALARRIWLSLVVEGREALFLDDIIDVLGHGRETDAEEAFVELDQDGNGDVSLDEMIMTVTEFSRERYAIANSLNDVDQAINVLDNMLLTVVFVGCVFIFVAFLNTSFITTLATAGTALLSLSFVFSVTAQEILGSCIFLFVKHPFDIGDRVDLTYGKDQLVVEHISLLFTVFRRIDTHRTVQIPNIVLNTLWIENVSRSKAMREQLAIDVSFDTTLEDVQLLRNEMSKFVNDHDNSRDFQPDVDVEVVGLGEMDKLQLQIEIRHKSNWSNETVRAARRSRFLCALVLALRRVPIYGPGGGDPVLGAAGNPSYSVSLPDSEAIKARASAAKDKDAARMVPSKLEASPRPGAGASGGASTLSPITEEKVADMLNERSPALDGTRDNGARSNNGTMDLDRVGSESHELEEVRGMLRRATTKGKRRLDRSPSALQSSGPSAQPPPLNLALTHTWSNSSTAYAPRLQQVSEQQQTAGRASLEMEGDDAAAPLAGSYAIPPPPATSYASTARRY